MTVFQSFGKAARPVEVLARLLARRGEIAAPARECVESGDLAGIVIVARGSSNYAAVPTTLMTWLTQRYPLVFALTSSWFAKPGSPQPLGRFSATRATSHEDLHKALVGTR